MIIKNIQRKIKNKYYKTMKGEIVKSKAELRIANFLYEQKIKYRYEPIVERSNGGINRPDFYLNDYDVFIEYFGMLGEKKYNYEIKLKLDTFKEEGLKVICLYPNNFKNVEYIIKKRFEELTKRTFPQRKFIPYYE